jgi:hypothetical protein
MKTIPTGTTCILPKKRKIDRRNSSIIVFSVIIKVTGTVAIWIVAIRALFVILPILIVIVTPIILIPVVFILIPVILIIPIVVPVVLVILPVIAVAIAIDISAVWT